MAEFWNSQSSATCVVWGMRESTHAPIIPDEFQAGAAGLKAIYGEIRALCAASGDDEMFPPTPYAVDRAIEILERTSYEMMRRRGPDPAWEFPSGYVNTDENGGLRVEWWHGQTHCVTLVVGHDQDAISYSFMKPGAGRAGRIADRGSIHPARLASMLHDLNRARS